VKPRFGVGLPALPPWHREELRTNLWLVPAALTLGALALFAITEWLDLLAYRGEFAPPPWVLGGNADPSRLLLTSIAASVITVVGVVFSITIVILTLASTQFGPRMLRNFIRDRGTQITLGAYVATFVYCIVVQVSIGPRDRGEFVPHISITTAFGLVLIDLAVLIYYIHHIALEIQLPEVIASIAKDLAHAVAVQSEDQPHFPQRAEEASLDDLVAKIETFGSVIRTPKSGYLQFIRHQTLVRVAAEADAVIRLPYRPGHFLVEGRELASVWPPAAAERVATYLARAQATGTHRTLTQDVAFGVDQLVEIAIRALSQAVNDTFTALTCIDWLGDGLCKIAPVWSPTKVHRDANGVIRVISDQVSYERLVQRAFEKIRQAGRGMPAIMIRQLDALTTIMEQTTDPERAQLLMDQAKLIHRANLESVRDASDRADVDRRYAALRELHAQLSGGWDVKKPSKLTGLE